MSNEIKQKVFEYYYHLLCFIILYENNLKNVQNIDLELKIHVQKMSDINQEFKLFTIHKYYSEMIYDLEEIVSCGLGYNELLDYYKDFILNIQTEVS